MSTPGTAARRLVDVHPTRRGLVLAWVAFTVTFAVLRALTYAIHQHVEGLGDITAGGVHLHHYLWGILLLAVVGLLGLVERSPRWHVAMGILYGVGLALVVDEFALLLNLRDVYWEREGRTSVDLALGIIGAAGALLSAGWFRTDRVERRAGERREQRQEATGDA